MEQHVVAARVIHVMPTSQADKTRSRLALGLMVVSGFAGLGYQIVWTQQSTLWLGHEAAAVLAVVAAFFGGIAVGAFMLGTRIDRSSHPARWYAACEAAIGLWSLALAFVMAPVTQWLLLLIGAQPSPVWQWTIAFCGTFVLLLPATAAMGATLPAMERVLAGMRSRGTSIAALYAGNTSGAVLGVLGAAFLLVPEFGLARTAIICSVLNLVCAALALRLSAAPADVAPAMRISHARRVSSLLALTGLLGIGYEVLVIRVLSQVAENTVYTFAILLAVYLIGTALGAVMYQPWASKCATSQQVGNRLLRLLSVVCLLGTVSLGGADVLKSALLHTPGPSMAVALGAEALIAMIAFLLPTVVMGTLFSHLSSHARVHGLSFGRVLGVNTLGAALAPLLFGVMLVPALGPKFSLLLVAVGYLALSKERAGSSRTFWTTAAAMMVTALWGPALSFIEIPEGGRIVSHQHGVSAAVSVIEDGEGVARLHINNRQQEGSSATYFSDARQAMLPLLLHPSPRHALFLGLGTGVTAFSAAVDPNLMVDAVELLPEVIEASAYFRRGENTASHTRVHLKTADARRYLRATHERYDVIVSDNFHPARSGSGSLYTVEHFKAVRERITAGGVFCQWLPLHQLDRGTLRSIVRSFITVYPDSWAMLATHSLDTPVIGLIAHRDAQRFDIDQLRTRLVDVAIPRGLTSLGIDDDLALLGSFIAGPRSLARFASDAQLNTDDHPVVTYLAPRFTYAPDSSARDRLITLLREMEIHPDELVDAPHGQTWSTRLSAYWAARNRFIEAGRDVQPTPDVKRMLAQVREPLLSVLRISPDFRPAYDPLLRMAVSISDRDAAAARALLTQLQQVQPARPEAAQALRALSAAAR